MNTQQPELTTEQMTVEMCKIPNHAVELNYIRENNTFSCSVIDVNGYAGNVWGVGSTIDESIRECYKAYLDSAFYILKPMTTSYITVTPETKERLMRDYGLTERDFETVDVEE